MSCNLCGYNRTRSAGSKRAYKAFWVEHLCKEVEENGECVPKHIFPLLYRALSLLEEKRDERLKRAAFLTLKVPRPSQDEINIS